MSQTLQRGDLVEVAHARSMRKETGDAVAFPCLLGIVLSVTNEINDIQVHWFALNKCWWCWGKTLVKVA
jgi:hypothetical protein